MDAQYNVNKAEQKRSTENVPYIVGGMFVVLFLCLCAWQIKRGLDNQATQAAFAAERGWSAWSNGNDVQSFDRIEVSGRYVNDRQLLLENIALGGRQGFYVITPLRLRDDEPLLLVNRGWILRESRRPDVTQLDVPEDQVTLRGRVGRLPRAGLKMDNPVSLSDAWPRTAVFPDYRDVAAAIGHEVQPFVLLLDAEDDFGFTREWQPVKYGAERNFGYALQWAAMALMLGGLLVWNYRRRGFEK